MVITCSINNVKKMELKNKIIQNMDYFNISKIILKPFSFETRNNTDFGQFTCIDNLICYQGDFSKKDQEIQNLIGNWEKQ